MKIANPIARRGEELAVEFLRKKGYKIIDRNFRRGYGEIDIVAIETAKNSPQSLVFVEVKTRTSGRFGNPLESINFWKLKSLIRTAQYYKMSHSKLPDSLRIDAVSILLTSENKVKSIEITKNISGF